MTSVRLQLIDPWVYISSHRAVARPDHWADMHGGQDGDQSNVEDQLSLPPLQNLAQTESSQTPAQIDQRRITGTELGNRGYLTPPSTTNISIAPVVESVSQPPAMLRGVLTLSVPETVHIKQIIVTLSGFSETSPQARKASNVNATSHGEVLLNRSYVVLDSDACRKQPGFKAPTFSSQCFPALADGNLNNPILRSPGAAQPTRKTLQAVSRRHSHSACLANLPFKPSYFGLDGFHQDRRLAGVNISTLAPNARQLQRFHARTQSAGIITTLHRPYEHSASPKKIQPTFFASASSPPIIHDQVFNDLVGPAITLNNLPGRIQPVSRAKSQVTETIKKAPSCELIAPEQETLPGDETILLPIEPAEACWGPSLLNFNEPCSVSLVEEIEEHKNQKMKTRSRIILKKSWSNLSEIFKLSFKKRRIPHSNPLPPAIHGENAGFIDMVPDYTPLATVPQLSSVEKPVRNKRRLRLSHSFNSMIVSPKPSLPSVRKVPSNVERRSSRSPLKPSSNVAVISNSYRPRPENLEDSQFNSNTKLLQEPFHRLGEGPRSLSALERKTWSEECKHGLPFIEFEPGEYRFPIVLPMPANLPPSFMGRFGSVAYRLRADVVRLGVIATDDTAIEVIEPATGPDMCEEELGNELSSSHGAITVERLWENQLHYTVSFNTRKCLIGGKINIELFLNPLCHMKVYKISTFLLQKASFFSDTTQNNLLQTDVTKFGMLHLSRQGPVPVPPSKFRGGTSQMEDFPLLPVTPDDPNAFVDSPLFGYFSRGPRPAGLGMEKFHEEELEDSAYIDDESAKSFSGLGPWNLKFDIKIPTCTSSKLKHENNSLDNVDDVEYFQSIHPSVTHHKSPIVLKHFVRFVMRVERGDDCSLDKKGRRKKYDIIIETPIQVVSCRCKPYELPTYSFENPVDSKASISALLKLQADGISDQLRQCHCNDEYDDTKGRFQLLSRLSRLKQKLVAVETEETMKNTDREADGFGLASTVGPEMSSLLEEKEICLLPPSAIHSRNTDSEICLASSSNFGPSSTQPFPALPWGIDVINSSTDLNFKTEAEVFRLPNLLPRLNQ